MAFLHEYGSVDYTYLLDLGTHVNAIKSIVAINAFPIVEDVQSLHSISIIAYKKTFWSKRQQALVILEYIQNAKADSSKFLTDKQTSIPKYADVLIGFGIDSKFRTFKIPGDVKTYEIGEPRTLVLSYGKLIEALDWYYDLFSREHLELLSNGMLLSPRYKILSKELADLRNVKNKLQFFEKFLSLHIISHA
jgi:hypothetical protein